ncbi:DNA-binding protein [Gallaecimonas sp. GXIMD4217]|uniref:DNA-binding protein n=1 Tax=Gallaecimonas sp. GXIMD4217 TaxID=3131927 RepID=UPI00311B002D
MPLNPQGHQLRANKDNVWKAAQALTEMGENPSVNNVRTWLGGGSNTSISRYLQEWHASSLEEKNVRLATPLHLQQSLDALFQQMEQEKSVQIQQAEAAFADQVQELKEQLQALQTALEGQQAENAELQSLCHEQQQRLAQGAQQAERQQQELLARDKALTELGARLEVTEQQLQAKDAQLGHLFHQQQHFQEKLQAAQKESLQALEDKLWQANHAIAQLTRERDKALEENRNLQGVVADARALEGQLQQARAQCEELQQQCQYHQGQAEAGQGQLARLEEALHDSVALDELKAELHGQRQSLATVEAQLAMLVEQVKKRQQLKAELEALQASLADKP